MGRTTTSVACGRRSSHRAALIVVLLVATMSPPLLAGDIAGAAAGGITTAAGGGDPEDGLGDGSAATAAAVRAPWGLEESSGELFVSENVRGRVRRVDAGGTIDTLAGGGVIPLGDGGPATRASLSGPGGVLVDAAGNILVVDNAAHRVRRVNPSGQITTIAGTGTAGFSGDGGPATNAELNGPTRIAADAAGNLYVSDSDNNRIRRISSSGVITTVAGDGAPASGGDGGSALAASLVPRGIAVDPAGRLYIADIGDDDDPPRIRRVDTSSGTITTFAGGGTLTPGGDGEGAPASDVAIGFPQGVDLDGAGNLYITTVIDYRVLRVDGATQSLTTVAGNGTGTISGDGGPATSAGLGFPVGVSVDASGNLFVAESDGNQVRRVDASSGIISRFAGDGTAEFGGDGGPATAAQLHHPGDVAAANGKVLIADSNNRRIRSVDASGIITTVAGGGIGDKQPATDAVLRRPRGLATNGAGGLLIADCGHQRVRMVAGGTITTFVGGLVPFRCPSGLHFVTSGPAAGTLYVADAGAHRVFRVAPGGAVSTVAGNGAAGFGGDGGPAAAAQLNAPSGVTLDGAGNLLVADTANSRVRKVTPGGVITTVAGDGTQGIGFDGLPATSTPVSEPTDVVVEASGAMIVAEAGLHRLRRVSPAGIISTVAGIGVPGYAGDGGPAAAALLDRPTQVDVDAAGALFFSDRNNARVRRIEPGTPPPPPTTGCGQVITANTTLTKDVGPCPGDGIVVGADNVTLNLNGHSVIGSDATGTAAGIRLYARRGVTVKGGGTSRARGTVRGFDVGVILIGGSGNIVRDLMVRDNVGPPVDDAIFGDGIGLFFSSDNQILSNVVANNGVYDGIGIFGFGSHRNLVQSNQVTGTTSQGDQSGGATGIGIFVSPFLSEELPRQVSVSGNRFLSNTVRDNENSGISTISNVDGVIRGNVVERNGLAPGVFPGNGIGVQHLTRAQAETKALVQGNRVNGNGGDGINITSSENRVLDNGVHANAGSGILVQGSTATSGHFNEIRNNDAANNVTGPFGQGDLVDNSIDEETFVFDCDSNTWFGNIWGSGGYWPDPAVLGDGGPVACTTTGGRAARGPRPTSASTAASITEAAAEDQRWADAAANRARGGRS